MRGGRSGWFAGPRVSPQPGGRQLCARAILVMLGSALLLLRSSHCSSSLISRGPPRFVGPCGFWEKACVTVSVLPNLEKAELKISQEIQPFVSSIRTLMLVFP